MASQPGPEGPWPTGARLRVLRALAKGTAWAFFLLGNPSSSGSLSSAYRAIARGGEHQAGWLRSIPSQFLEEDPQPVPHQGAKHRGPFALPLLPQSKTPRAAPLAPAPRPPHDDRPRRPTCFAHYSYTPRLTASHHFATPRPLFLTLITIYRTSTVSCWISDLAALSSASHTSQTRARTKYHRFHTAIPPCTPIAIDNTSTAHRALASATSPADERREPELPVRLLVSRSLRAVIFEGAAVGPRHRRRRRRLNGGRRLPRRRQRARRRRVAPAAGWARRRRLPRSRGTRGGGQRVGGRHAPPPPEWRRPRDHRRRASALGRRAIRVRLHGRSVILVFARAGEDGRQ